MIVTRVFLQLREYAETHRTIVSGGSGGVLDGGRVAGIETSIQFAVLNSTHGQGRASHTAAPNSYSRPPRYQHKV